MTPAEDQAPTAVAAAPVHPYVQHLIDTAPRLEGRRRDELAALLLQARATAAHDEGAARTAAPVAPADASAAADLVEVSRAG